MQNITIAVGKTGVNFFSNSFLVNKILGLLNQLTPPDKTIPISYFHSGGVFTWNDYSGISVALSNGQLTSFQPVFQGLSQAGQIFTLIFQANNLNVSYVWLETFTATPVRSQGRPPYIIYGSPQDESNKLNYNLSIQSLQISVTVQFIYNNTAQAWEITVGSVSPQLNGINASIPQGSILKSNCGSDNIGPATEQAIETIDLATPVNALIKGILQTIPGSGDLGNGIVYDFSLGDFGLLFPNGDGIQMGVKGGASYNNTNFPGTLPAALPLPTVPADSDTHHLNMYVGGYELDALNWAFFQAGKLNTVVNPTDLPDPDVLKVKTYLNSEPSLKPYQAFVMQAHITQNTAPVTTFQTVYELGATAMENLKAQLPQNVYELLSGLQGNNYVSQSALETDLKDATISSTYFSSIEQAAKSMGMVVTHNINYTLEIQNFQPTLPNIIFNIQRVDILGNLALGIGTNQAQTLQFQFNHASWQATFVSSTVSQFDGSYFPSTWNIVGEPRYDQLLATLGASGVPLPIMQGLQFDFGNTRLSINEGYVSILANVLYKN